MTTKLGYHVQGWTPGVLDTVRAARAPILKTMSPEVAPIRAVLDARPDTTIVLRRYFDDGQQRRLLDRGEDGGREAAELVLAEFVGVLNVAPGAYVEGLNEIGLWDDADRYSAFTVGFAEACARHGVRPAVYSFPTGNPPGYVDGSPEDLRAYWAHYLPGLEATQAAGGALALHEYDAPTMRRLGGWLCLRYRRVYDILPERLRALPLLITETGIDGGVLGAPRESAGWRAYASAEEYAAELAWYDDELQRDAQVIGATIFTAGNLDVWGSFDVTGVWQVAELIRRRADAPPPLPEPEPLPAVLHGEDLVRAIVPIAAEEGVSAKAIVALAWAESTWRSDARRPADPAADRTAWPDVSMGPFQQTVRWSDEFVALGQGSGYPGPDVVEQIGRRYYDVDHATRVAARRLKTALDRSGGHLLDALCLYNRPNGDPLTNPNRARYARAIEEARRLLATLEVPPVTTIGNLDVIDLRARYPSGYGRRPLAAITTLIVHHTAGATVPVDASVADEMATLDAIHAQHSRPDWPSPAEGPGPGIAYHLAVLPSGRCYLLGDWDTVRWHSGGDANRYGLAIVLPGHFDSAPPGDEQLAAARRLVAECRYQLGNGQIGLVGHQDVASTHCPGLTWPQWRDRLESEPAIDPVRVQLDALWGLSAYLPAAQAGEQQRAIVALKAHLGIE